MSHHLLPSLCPFCPLCSLLLSPSLLSHSPLCSLLYRDQRRARKPTTQLLILRFREPYLFMDPPGPTLKRHTRHPTRFLSQSSVVFGPRAGPLVRLKPATPRMLPTPYSLRRDHCRFVPFNDYATANGGVSTNPFDAFNPSPNLNSVFISTA
jgi:hypothetical protein